MSSENGNLHAALRALAAETAGAEAPDKVRLALAAELRRRARRRAAVNVAKWWPAAAAAALAIGVWLGRPAPADPAPAAAVVAEVAPAPAPVEAPPAPAPEPRARLASTSTAAASPASAVTPWFFYAGLPQAQRGQVVRIRVNAATAAHFGVYRGSDDVPAQVFIGDDGVARAIRFVR